MPQTAQSAKRVKGRANAMGRRPHLSKAHFIREDSILSCQTDKHVVRDQKVNRTFGPKVGQPIQTSQLKILQLAPSFHNIFRIRIEPFKCRSLVFWIMRAAVWELALCFPSLVRLDLGFGGCPNGVVGFPGAMLVAQASPLAEILDLAIGSLALRDNSFNLLVTFLFFPLALLVKEEGFVVFS